MRAIDIHTHIPRHPSLDEYGIEPGLRRMFRMEGEPDDVDRMKHEQAASRASAQGL